MNQDQDTDNFSALLSSSSGLPFTVHNVRLVDVQPTESGLIALTVEHAGMIRQLTGNMSWSETYSRCNVGKMGAVMPDLNFRGDLPAGACFFRAYVDQSLRRAPELDLAIQGVANNSRAVEVVGWRCNAHPRGFRAPIGLIPGEDGRFVPDQTEVVTLRVPPEFLRECRRHQMEPDQLLRSFVGDLSGIQNYVTSPRADCYGSNGSDEREYADAWLRRAHGIHAIDLDAKLAQEEEEEHRQYQRDDFADLLDYYVGHGGNADDLTKVVKEIVDRRAAESAAEGQQTS